MTTRLALVTLVAMASIGCGRVHLGTHDGGGQARDGGAAHDGGGARQPCGRVLCDVGLECCNASCGVCTLPGLGCTAIACEDECRSNADCPPEQHCLFALGACGETAEPGVCSPRTDVCPAISAPVCGCDGVTYDNGCHAAAAGVSVRSDGPCPIAPGCAPQDATAVGPCEAELGVRWDGSRCFAISGCSCEGPDCGALFDTVEACQAAYAGCSCRAQDAVGVGPCAAILGVRWNGRTCEAIGGCSCEGADCSALYRDEASCQAAHAVCRCAPLDARGSGDCAAVFGVTWDGARCTWISGCGCAGTECDRAYDTIEECQAAHSGC